MSLKNSLGEKIGDNLSENVSLANYSWFNLGGNAEYFYKAKNLNELIKFLDVAKKENLKTVILGAGSNILTIFLLEFTLFTPSKIDFISVG